MGTKNSHLYTLSPHYLVPMDLVAQLVERHTGNISVWVRSPEKNLGTCIQVLQFKDSAVAEWGHHYQINWKVRR